MPVIVQLFLQKSQNHLTMKIWSYTVIEKGTNESWTYINDIIETSKPYNVQ